MYILVFAAFFLPFDRLSAQDIAVSNETLTGETVWFRSNASGMALEQIPSRLAALREEYCVSVRAILPDELPDIVLPYYDDLCRESGTNSGSPGTQSFTQQGVGTQAGLPFSLEVRVLYEQGVELRRQWICRDSRNLTRLSASGTPGFFGIDNSENETKSGFIEIRDAEGALTRELTFNDDLSEWDFRYIYNENVLVKMETWYKNPPPAVLPAETAASGTQGEGGEADSVPANDSVSSGGKSSGMDSSDADSADSASPANESSNAESPDGAEVLTPAFALMITDNYRYTRSGSIRAIDRVLYDGAAAKLSRVSFPALGPGFPSAGDLVNHGVAYSSDFLSDVANTPPGTQVSYTLDSRGRILTEIWKDKDGQVIGEYLNTWDGDKLKSVRWKTDDEERIVEYEYDADGNRVTENNYMNGVLERRVTTQGDRDTEDIYMNGRLVLRAHWEKGMKVSEERVFTGSANPNTGNPGGGPLR